MVFRLKLMSGNQNLALLMIDFQRDFCENGGYAWRHGGTDWVEPILPKAEGFARLRHVMPDCRCFIPGKAMRQIFPTVIPQKLTRSRAGGCEIGSAGPLGRLLIRGEAGHEFIPLLAPQRGEVVIDKCSYSAFHETELLSKLTALDVTELLVAGVTADVCVHSTLRSATEYGFLLPLCCRRDFYFRSGNQARLRKNGASRGRDLGSPDDGSGSFFLTLKVTLPCLSLTGIRIFETSVGRTPAKCRRQA